MVSYISYIQEGNTSEMFGSDSSNMTDMRGTSSTRDVEDDSSVVSSAVFQTETEKDGAKNRKNEKDNRTKIRISLRNCEKWVLYLCVFVFCLSILGVVSAVLVFPWSQPVAVMVTNVTDRSATVSWVTEEAVRGVVIYGESESFLPSVFAKVGREVAFDDRDVLVAKREAAERAAENLAEKSDDEARVAFEDVAEEVVVSTLGDYYVHHVTISGLEPEKTYYFMVGNGLRFSGVGEKGVNGEIATFAELDSIDVPSPAYGVINFWGEHEYPVTDGVVYMELKDGEAISSMGSAVLGENGSWYIDLNSIRGKDGTAFMSWHDEENVREVLTIETGPNGKYQKEISTDMDAPADDIEVLDPEIELNQPDVKYVGITASTASSQVSFVKSVFAFDCNEIPDGDPEKTCSKCKGTKEECNVGCNYFKNNRSQERDCGPMAYCGERHCNPSSSGDGSCECECPDSMASCNDPQKPKCEKNKCVPETDQEASVSEGKPCDIGGGNTVASGTCGPDKWACWDDGLNGGRNPSCKWALCRNGIFEPSEDCCKGRGTDKAQACDVSEGNADEMDDDSSNAQSNGESGEGDNENNDTSDATCSNPGQHDHQINFSSQNECLGSLPENASADNCKEIDNCWVRVNINLIKFDSDSTWYYVIQQGSTCNDPKDKKCWCAVTGRFIKQGEKCLNIIPSRLKLYPGEKCEGSLVHRPPWEKRGTCNCDHWFYHHIDEGLYCPHITPLDCNLVATSDPDKAELYRGKMCAPDTSICQCDMEKGVEDCVCKLDKGALLNKQENVYSSAIGKIKGFSLLDYFTSHINAQEETSSIYIFPEDGVIGVREEGEYCVQYEGAKYCFEATEALEAVVYIDINQNGVYDEGDINFSDDAVKVTLSQESVLRQWNVRAGFNFVSFDFVNKDFGLMASEVLANLNYQYQNSFYSIASFEDGRWVIVGNREGKTYASSDFQIIPGKGYLLKSGRSFEMKRYGQKVTSPVPVSLVAGWNLVGVHGAQKAYTASSLIDSIDAVSGLDADNVTQWETSLGRYQGLQKSQDKEGAMQVYGFDFDVDPLSAYFVRLAAGSGVWRPETK